MKLQVLLFFISGYIFSFNHATSSINDNYCDSIDGSDENTTSACSHLPNAIFSCNTTNKWSQSIIPSSRVNDGVCDCCDGSDETSIHNPSCSNKCEASLNDMRKQALSMHRNIQAGMRARTELVEAFKLSKSKEVKQLEAMKAEYNTLDKMLFKMMLFLQKEEHKEGNLRFALLREREHHCGQGSADSCDYFRTGFLDEDELMHEGFPLEYAKKRQRFHWEHSESEIEHLQRLTGYERVKLSICTVRDLLPDDDARIFTQVGELLSFADSPGGRISRKVTPRERKLGTLFGKFLDNGERGLVQGQLLLLEMAGLLLSPVTLFIRLLGFVYGQVAQRTWYHVERCAYPMHSFAAGNLTLVQNDTIQTELRSLGAFVPVTTVDVCKLILQSDVEGSVVADALSVLDYTRYSAVMTFLDVWGEALETPAYTWEVIYRAPLMYWDYYVLGRTAQLPPRRQCCLLRAGIDAAREEMERLKQRLAAKEALISETASKRYVPLSVSGPSNVPASSASSSAKKRGRRDEAERKVLLDLGPEGSWESVLNTCLETKREVTAEALAPGEQTAPPHFYRFCFFGEITQDGVRSLGRFAYWGSEQSTKSKSTIVSAPVGAFAAVGMDGTGLTLSEEQVFIEVPEDELPAESTVPALNTGMILEDLAEHPHVKSVLSVLQSAASTLIDAAASASEYVSRRNRLAGVPPSAERFLRSGVAVLRSAYSSLFGSPEERTAASSQAFKGTPEEVQAHYSAQVYLHGAHCSPGHGAPRKTLVRFECGMTLAITDVVETQMCEYAMTVSTPLVCSKHLEEASLQRLDELGVFGFSGSANSNNANSNSNSHKNSGKEQKKNSGGSGGAGSSKKGGTTSKGKGGDQSANHGKHT